jgi:hypothetical protein
LHFDLLFFGGCFFVLHFSHFFTNKLIFKFIGFWLSGCNKYIYFKNVSFNMNQATCCGWNKQGMPRCTREYGRGLPCEFFC